MKRTLPLPLPLLLLVLVGAAGVVWFLRGGGIGGGPPNLLLVTFDTTRADHIGCYGYLPSTTPTVDRLAAEGCLFLDAEAPSPLTLPSHASMLTGLLPPSHGLQDNGAGGLSATVSTLAERLRDEAGYATAAFISAEPLASQYGLDRGFDVYDDELGSGSGGYGYAYGYGPGAPYAPAPRPGTAKGARIRLAERPGRLTTDRALAWLAGERPTSRPFFLWVHFFEPHMPHEPAADFKPLFKSAYDAEIRTADAQLARLLKALEAAGLGDRTVVAFAADHGEGLGEHGELTHALLPYRTTQRVPLIVAAPGAAELAGVVCTEPVSVTGIHPTLLALAGLEVAPSSQSRDLLAVARGNSSARGIYAESLHGWRNFRWAPIYSWRSGSLRLIHGSRTELFDVMADPGETIDLAAERPVDVARLLAELAAARAAMPQPPARSGGRSVAPPSPFGPYVDTGGPVPPVPTRQPESVDNRRDPRDGLGLATRFDLAKAQLGSASFRGARKSVAALLVEEPGNPFLHILMARAAKGEGDLESAGEHLRIAEDLDAGNPEIQAGLLDIRILRVDEVEDTEARAEAIAVLAVDADAYLAGSPDNASLQLNRGRIHLLAGETAAAEASFRRALRAGDERARPLLVQTLLELGHRADALEELAAGSRGSASLEAVRRRMLAAALVSGQGAYGRGDLDEAFFSFSYAVSVDDGASDAHLGLARTLHARHDLARALEHASLAAKLDGKSVEARMSMADILIAAGRPRDAADVLARVLELDQANRRAKELLERLGDSW